MPGASPMVDDLDTVRRLEDAGAAAIVMHSLFEEQIVARRREHRPARSTRTSESSRRGGDLLPGSPRISRSARTVTSSRSGRFKRAVAVPVIASLNGVTDSGWLEYARLMRASGRARARAERLPRRHRPERPRDDVEARARDVLRSVKRGLGIPVAVKLSPFYSSLANLARQLDELGADGLVLFNRFYQPDIDLEKLEVVPGPPALRLVGAAPAPALARDPLRAASAARSPPRAASTRPRRRQGGHGGRARGADGVGRSSGTDRARSRRSGRVSRSGSRSTSTSPWRR